MRAWAKIVAKALGEAWAAAEVRGNPWPIG